MKRLAATLADTVPPIPAPAAEESTPLRLGYDVVTVGEFALPSAYWVMPAAPRIRYTRQDFAGIMVGVGHLEPEPQRPPAFQLEVSSARDCLTVCDQSTGIFGAGSTIAEAFTDFAAAIVEHRDVLSRQSQLSPALSRQLEYIRQRLPE